MKKFPSPHKKQPALPAVCVYAIRMQVREGGFAMIHGASGSSCGSIALRVLAGAGNASPN